MSSPPSIPAPADEPDAREGDEFWNPSDEELPATAAGVLVDRREVKFQQPRIGRGNRVRETFAVYEIEAPGGDVLHVPMGRAHAAELDEKEAPQIGDGVAVTVFRKRESGGYPYALRVSRNGRPHPDQGSLDEGAE
jgi:hypothetical protein